MKVVITTDIPLYFVAGSTSFILRMGELLIARGHSVMVVCPGRGWRNEMYRHESGIEVCGTWSFPAVLQKYLRLSFPLFSRRHIEKAFRDFRPDIVHAQSHFLLPPLVIRVARRMRVTTVGTNHFIPENIFHHFHPPRWLEESVRAVSWKHLHLIFGRLHHVTTPTETAAGFMRASGFPKDVHVISNGVDLSRFNPQGNGEYLRTRYDLPQKPIVLYVGRLDPEKHLEDAIRALPHLKTTAGVHMLIVGRGAKDAALKKLARRLSVEDVVTFTGYLPDEDLPSVYRLASCFIMPGTAELQCIAAMEAMASGLPVVAADALALPELVHHGTNGFLYEPGNARDLAQRIADVLADPERRAQMGEESRKIASVHDLNRTVEAFEDFYRAALSGTKQ